MFSDYIKGFDYWGHCDLDLIFGDLKKFLPKEEYDKLSFQGHFCMYKNRNSINMLFLKDHNGSIDYSEILSHNQHFGFDEIGNYGINSIFERNHLKVIDFKSCVADVDCRRRGLYCGRRRYPIFKSDIMMDDEEKLFIFNEVEVITIWFLAS